MQASVAFSHRARKIAIITISFLLILLNQFSGIRDADPFNYWFASTLVVAILFALTKPALLSIRNEPSLAHVLLLPLLVFAIYIPLMSGWNEPELKAALKYSLIAVLMYAAYRAQLSTNQFLLIVAGAFAVQVIIFFLAFTQWAILPLEHHGNRHGLNLATYGTIWRLAGLTFPFFIYSALRSDKVSSALVYLLLAGGAIAVNLLDGTRTGFLILIVGGLGAVGLALWKTEGRRQIIIRLALTAVIVFGSLYASSTFHGIRAAQILNHAVSSLTGENGLSIERIDGNRQRQLETAFTAISENPLTGRGWLESKSVDNYVIHNVYLQTWADLGLFGMLLYIGIFTPAFCAAALWLRDRQSDEHLLLPITIVLGYLFSSLFHPISTELTEWVLIAFSLGLLIRYLSYDQKTA